MDGHPGTQASNSAPHNILPDSDSKTIVIPASLTVLTKDFFQNPESVDVVTFEAGSQIRRLESGTFAHCISLTSICIAASVEFLDTKCFRVTYDRSRTPLKTVTFEAGSHLREIAPDAFSGCLRLERICIPASVEKLGALSFPALPLFQIEIEHSNPYFAEKGDDSR
jgi:hypothetical protein